jgi:hypothetical protein
MSEQLTAALEMLTSTTNDVELMARFVLVDAAEVAKALASAETGSSDEAALRLLAKYNPYTPPTRYTPPPSEE